MQERTNVPQSWGGTEIKFLAVCDKCSGHSLEPKEKAIPVFDVPIVRGTPNGIGRGKGLAEIGPVQQVGEKLHLCSRGYASDWLEPVIFRAIGSTLHRAFLKFYEFCYSVFLKRRHCAPGVTRALSIGRKASR